MKIDMYVNKKHDGLVSYSWGLACTLMNKDI